MWRFIALRFLQAIPSMLGVSIIGFLLVHMVPGGPAQAMLGARATAQKIAEVDRMYGLNKPLVVQYVVWMGQILRGNLGESYFYNRSVWSLVHQALPNTLAIVGIGVILAEAIAIGLGTLQAYYRRTWFDYLATTVSYILYAMPTFWLAVIVILVLSVGLNWFPAGGLNNPLTPNPGIGSWVAHTTLPVLTITLGTVAGWSLYMRAAMQETLVQDFIRTARAKGLTHRTVVVRHALRNSLLPLISLFGLSVPGLFTGALYVEVVFNYPGMGYLFWNAAVQRDYPVILAVVMLTGVLTILGNLLADVLYSVADPRIKYG